MRSRLLLFFLGFAMTTALAQNVGIGTSATQSLLTLRGPDHSVDGPTMFMYGNVTDQIESGRIRFAEGGTNNWRGAYMTYNGSSNKLHIGIHDVSDTNPANDQNIFTIERTTGMVGIQTESPASLLHLNNGVDASLSGHGYLLLGPTSGSNLVMDNNEIMARNNGGPADLLVQHNGGDFIVAGNETGNLGVGTTTPEYPVHIEKNGTAGAPTIDLVLESATSKRPTILFSENFSGLDLNDGMSLEYDGAISGNKFYVNGVGGIPRLTVESSGNVGIGTTNPNDRLEVVNTGDVKLKIISTDNSSCSLDFERAGSSFIDWRIQGHSDGTLKFYSGGNIDSSPTEYYRFTSTSFRPAIDNALDFGAFNLRWDDIYATNGFIQTSDRRLKKDVEALKYGLNEVKHLRPVTFLWNDKTTSDVHLGLIAQEVLDIVPEVVHAEHPERLGMNYTELVPVLINAIQELSQEVDNLKHKVEGQVRQLEILRNQTQVKRD